MIAEIMMIGGEIMMMDGEMMAKWWWWIVNNMIASVGIGHCPIPSIGLLDFGPNGLSPLQLQFQMDYYL